MKRHFWPKFWKGWEFFANGHEIICKRRIGKNVGGQAMDNEFLLFFNLQLEYSNCVCN